MNTTVNSVLEHVQADIKLVEEFLCATMHSPVALVENVCTHTLSAGGKRLRPAFLILSAKLLNSNVSYDRAVPVAACMELVHMATLIHDDVIDHTSTRRGFKTAAALYGNTASILSGDVLLAKSMCLLADDGDLEVIRTVSRAVQKMAEGEAREVETRNNLDLTINEHLHILNLKTACFVECCCETGGLIALGSPHEIHSLAAYGYNLGMSFQIIDDLLDYTGNPDATGKPQLTDFAEGCATYPLIHFLAHADDRERTAIQSQFGKPVDLDFANLISQKLEDKGSYSEARRRAAEFAEAARASLMQLPSNQYRDLLEAVIDFVLERKF